MSAELTTDELAVLTPLGMLAYNLARENAGDDRIPCWLCTSEDARDDAVHDAVDWLNQQMKPIVPYNEERAAMLAEQSLRGKLQQWIDCEAELKRLRAINEPSAFFAPKVN